MTAQVLGCHELDESTVEPSFDDTEVDVDVGVDTAGLLRSVVQAESFTFANGCRVSTDRPSYKGAGFVRCDPRGILAWNHINAPSAGPYRLRFRYANDHAAYWATVTVNGVPAGGAAFTPTRNERWRTEEVLVELKAGNNLVRLDLGWTSEALSLDQLVLLSADGAARAAGSDGYEGTGDVLPLQGYMLEQCESHEQALLTQNGFPKVRRVSVGAWTDIVTIQASELIQQELVDAVAKEMVWALSPIIERYPERARALLDANEGTINIVMVYGLGAGWSGSMGHQGMLFKRNGAQDGGLFHELGHVFDLHDSTPQVHRDHIDSILTKEDAAVLDQACHRDPAFLNADGSCQYSEYVAEAFRKMCYPDWRSELSRDNPEVYRRMLKYVPTPSSYVPFAGVPLYDLP